MGNKTGKVVEQSDNVRPLLVSQLNWPRKTGNMVENRKNRKKN